MPKKKKTYFQKSWLDQEQYEGWLAEAPDNTNGKCKLCKKVFELSNMAANALKSQAPQTRNKKSSSDSIIFR